MAGTGSRGEVRNLQHASQRHQRPPRNSQSSASPVWPAESVEREAAGIGLTYCFEAWYTLPGAVWALGVKMVNVGRCSAQRASADSWLAGVNG